MIGLGFCLTATAMRGTRAQEGTSIALTSGAGYQGSVLTSSQAGQWYASGQAIAGKTGATLAITAALEGQPIRCGTSPAWQMWTPSAAAPLLHLRPERADKITVSAGAVSALTDTAGGVTLMQTTAASQPQTGRDIGGIPALDFDGGDSLTISGISSPFTGGGDSMMAMVVNPDAVTGTAYLLGSAVGMWRFGLAIVSSRFRYYHNNALIGADFVAATGPQIVLGYRSGSATYIRQNGLQRGTAAAGTAPAASAITLGEGFDGVIAESVAWTSYSEGTRDKLEGYLAHKYGLAASLPDDHPYKSAAPRIS